MIRKQFLTYILVLIGFGLNSQENFVLHNFTIIPQNYLTNPAIKNPSKFIFGIPAATSLYTGISINSFSFNDLFKDDPNSDSLLLDIGGVIESLNNDMNFNLSVQEDLVFLGIRINNGFFSLGAGLRAESDIYLDKDLLELLWYGNADTRFYNKLVDFSGTNLNLLSYMQIHFGYSFNFKENWIFGGRIKFLKGLGNIHTEKFEASMYTLPDAESVYTIETHSDILINTSLMDDLRFFDEEDSGDTENSDDFDVLDLLKQKNSGMAFDLGFRYLGFKRFEIAASIIDLGKINWKENVANYSTGEVNYDFNGLIFEDINDDGDDVMDNLLDTLDSRFSFTKTYNVYKTALVTKFYVGGSYILDAKSQLDALLYGRAFGGHFKTAFSLGFNRYFGRTLGFKVAYTMYNQNYSNIGLGLSLNLGPLQTYLITENIFAATNIEKAKSLNLRFGLNLNFRDRIKKKTDTIVVEKSEEKIEY